MRNFNDLFGRQKLFTQSRISDYLHGGVSIKMRYDMRVHAERAQPHRIGRGLGDFGEAGAHGTDARAARASGPTAAAAGSFLETLEAGGIRTGDYNLPDREESREGFQACLTALMRVTPPTAIIISETVRFAAAQRFLGRCRIRVPENASLIGTDPNPNFAWCVPSIAHIRWDSCPVVRPIVRWAASVCRGRLDLKQSFVAAEYVPGGTVGPAPAD